MAEVVTTYATKVSGLLGSRHELRQGQEALGVLVLKRSGLGVVVAGDYRPVKGEGFVFRRDPGLLRDQFTMWSDGREWIGSSLRFHAFKRVIELNTGGKPFRLAPLPGFSRGWSLYAPKTGELARVSVGLLSRAAEIEVYRKTPFPLLLLSYFLACQHHGESLWGGPAPEKMAAE